MGTMLFDTRICVRGAGDLASGVALKLYRCGFRRLLMTETACPLAVRRMVSFCEAIHEGVWEVEGVRSRRATTLSEVFQAWDDHLIPVMVDPENAVSHEYHPEIIVDAIMAKRNVGTSMSQADFVIALGPGFEAGRDAHAVVETHRGHNLGRIIWEGSAFPDTGVPGDIGGKTAQRVLRAPAEGIFESSLPIGAVVREGATIGYVAGIPVESKIDGVLRGLIRPGTFVAHGLKIGDVDPRGEVSYCFSVSDKARAIAGGVLEAILGYCYEKHRRFL
jgi:xanthine dehydrogenase accessory factor